MVSKAYSPYQADEDTYFLTLTLNPSFDNFIILKSLLPNTKNVPLSSTLQIGGKGVNIAKALIEHNINSLSTGILPFNGSSEYLEMLNANNIENNFVISTEGSIRENLKLYVQENYSFFEINNVGSNIPKEKLHDFLRVFKDLVKRASVLFLSGSIPSSIPDNFYSTLIFLTKKLNPNTLIAADTSGKNLESILSVEQPHILHINLEERNQSSLPENMLSWIQEQHLKHILISNGKNLGYIYSSNIADNFSYHPPKVDAVSVAGAGDALLASFVTNRVQNKNVYDSIKYSVAYASASTQLIGTTMSKLTDSYKLLDQVIVKKLTI